MSVALSGSAESALCSVECVVMKYFALCVFEWRDAVCHVCAARKITLSAATQAFSLRTQALPIFLTSCGCLSTFLGQRVRSLAGCATACRSQRHPERLGILLVVLASSSSIAKSSSAEQTILVVRRIVNACILTQVRLWYRDLVS